MYFPVLRANFDNSPLGHGKHMFGQVFFLASPDVAVAPVNISKYEMGLRKNQSDGHVR